MDSKKSMRSFYIKYFYTFYKIKQKNPLTIGLSKYLFILLGFYFSSIFASDHGWNIFQHEIDDNGSFCGTDSLISALIDNKVSAISGEYIDGQEDLTLVGPEPLKWQRFYSANLAACMCGIDSYIPTQKIFRYGAHYCNWQFNYKTVMYLQFETNGHARHLEATALVPHLSSANMVHKSLVSNKHFQDSSFTILLHSQKGISNCSMGCISARTNPKNVTAIYDEPKKYCKVYYGNGGLKAYAATVYEYYFDKENEFLMYQLEPFYEKRANGNQIFYQKNQVSAYNSTGTTLFSWVKLIRQSDTEFRLESSHFDPLIYQYQPLEVINQEPGNYQKSYYLTALKRPDQPNESYEYTRNMQKTGWLLQRKNLPDNRFFEVDYNFFNDWIDENKTSKIMTSAYPHANRVKSLKAPVGTDSTPLVTHRIFYDIDYKIDRKKDVTEVYRGSTTVFDALDRKSVYTYNSSHLLESFKQYSEGACYKETRYLWKRVSIEKEYQPNVNSLLGKVVLDENAQILMGRFFKYDKKGNILSDHFYGNLTGTKSIPIILGPDKYPLDNGVECYKKSFKYSNDKFNLLLEEKTDNGRGICYGYVPNTDLICHKFILENDVIRAREFYEYDENNALIKLVRDNGSASTIDDFTDITERQVIHYFPRKTIPVGLPEQIDEMVEDVATREKILAKRILQEFSKEGRLQKQEIYDANGNYCYESSWEHDKHGNVIKEVTPLGYKILRKYDKNDNLIQEKYVEGECTVNYTYDFSNRLICQQEIHPRGETFSTHFKYDLVGNRISEIDRFGNETLYFYDDLNRLVETIYPSIQVGAETIHPSKKIKYDVLGNVVKEVDAKGFHTKKSYNSRGQLISLVQPDGQLEKYEYGLDGSLIKKIASNGTMTCFQVDCFGRILKETVFNKAGDLLFETSNEYNSLHKISSTDATGLKTYYEYDLFGRLSKTICADKVETYKYDSLGRLTKKKEPFENGQTKVTCHKYDFLDRLIEERIEDDEGTILKKVAYRYDVWGNRTHVIEETQAGLSVQVTRFNPDKKIVKTVDPQGNKTQMTYDYTYRNPLNQFVLQTKMVDSIGRQTIITHNSHEKPVKIELKDAFGTLLQAQDIVYDAMGNVISLIDHEILMGEEIRIIESAFEYQETGQLSCIIQAKGLPEQQITHLRYNKFGQKKLVTKPNGTILRYKYDSLGRLSRYYSSDHSLSYEYAYNVRNQVVKVNDLTHQTSSELFYDELGRLVKEKLANGIVTSYQYDLLDRMITLNLPNENTVVYQYDALYLKQIQRYKKGTLLFTHRYEDRDLAGLNLRATTIDNKKITYVYNPSKCLLSVESDVYKQTKAIYDQVGRLTNYQMHDSVEKFPVKLGYNDLNQLILEEGNQKQTYACDSLHRRILKNGNPSTFNGLHQLITDGEFTYDYDRVGNLISKGNSSEKITYAYDADNQLIGVNADQAIHYTYDSFHRRMSKIENGKITRYMYMGQDEIGSMDEGGEIVELRVLGESQGVQLRASVAIEVQDKIYVPWSDFQGNIIGLTDLEGKAIETYRYTAFGETTIYDEWGSKIDGSHVENPWQFSNKRVDIESGYVYFGRRYYDPKNGRWITADPAGLIDGTNLYAYLHHNPVGAWDLYGLFEETQQSEEPVHYPLQNVDLKDSPALEFQTPEELSIAQANPDLVLKRSGKTGNSYSCGNIKSTFMGFLNIHGIMNKLKDAHSAAKRLSDDLGGQEVHFVYDESQGFVPDIVRCAAELFFYMDTNRVLNARMEIRDRLAETYYLFIQPHSEGGIVTRNAMRGLSIEERRRIIVVGFACAAYMSADDALKVKYYISQRDIVPFFDIRGRIRCRDVIEVLEPHPEAPWFDHTIASPTYRKHQKDEALTALKTYGGVV